MGIEFLIAQSVVNGLVLGMLYLLMAVGFTLVFGVMRVVNFAHGEFYMLGAFVLYFVFAEWELPFFIGVAAAFFSVLALGAVTERVVFRPFHGDELSGMIASIGLALILQNLALMAFGPDPFASPSFVSGVWRVGSFVLPLSRLVVIVAAVAILLAFYLFLMHSRYGRALRAVVQDTEIATAYGVRPNVIFPLGMGLGVGLAAIGGALMAPLFSVSPFIGATPLLKAFIVVILGGLGSIPGAALASLLLGLIESFTSTFFGASTADILQLVIVMLILIFRPWGLLGQKEA